MMDKMDRNRLHIATIILRWVTASLLVLPQGIFAIPTGGAVVEGEATIGVNPSNPQHQIITQTSSKAIIDWQSFSIGSQETTQFIQPDAAAIALNRVVGGDPSVILGTLRANGQVWLINPAGVLFGHSATVDVAGLLATTSDISNSNFMNGHYHFLQPLDKSTSVINQGQIKIKDSGIAALVAPAVHNSGVIQANLGKVVLASGTEFTVDLYGDNLIHFALNQPKLLATSSGGESNLFDTEGKPLKEAVANSGQIIANGGKILLTTAAAKQVVESLINMSGVVQANSVVKQGGKVILQGNSAVKEGDKFIWQGKGENEGLVKVTGKIEARGEKGGQVTITGKRVGLFSEGSEKQAAFIDVSGIEKGGEVLVGGDFQGKGTLPWAEAVVMQKGTRISADALSKGDGGTVVLWSESCTRFYGDISARGGKGGGNGGLIETSGHWLDVRGKVDASASNSEGLAGKCLLDPWDVTIGDVGDNDGAFVPIGGVQVWTPSGGALADSRIDNGTLQGMLDAGNIVEIQTAAGTGIDPGQAGDIHFGVGGFPFATTGAGPLTLRATGSISIENGINSPPLTLVLITPGSVTAGANPITVGGLQLSVGTVIDIGYPNNGGGNPPAALSSVSGNESGSNITLLNTFGPGTHFFNGNDLYQYLSSPAPPPTPPKPPTNVIAGVLDPVDSPFDNPPTGIEDRPSLIETQSPPPSSPPASSPPAAAPPPAETPPAEAPPAEPPAAAPPNEAPAPVAPPPTPERTEPPGYDVPGGTDVIGGGSEGREPIETPEGAGGQEGIAEGAFNPEVERTEEVDMPCPVNFEETKKPIPPNCPEKPRGPVSAESLADAEVSPDSEIGKELNRAPIGPEGITGIDVPVGAAGIGGNDLGQEKIETAEAAGGDESLLARDNAQYGFSLEDIDRSPEYLENLGPKRPEPLSLWGQQMFARLKRDVDEEWS